MTVDAVKIEGGFAEVAAGSWLMSRGQPTAFFGSAFRRRRKGFFLRDRSSLDLVETSASVKCAYANRPFLTPIPCAAKVFAVSNKVLVAPSAARTGAEMVKVIPMSAKGALCVTVFDLVDERRETRDELGGERRGTGNAGELGDVRRETGNAGERRGTGASFVVMATGSRTARLQVAEGDTLSARPEAVVAWTGNRPTGFCPKLGLLDMLLPRGPKDLLLNFYGPCLVWVEGSRDSRLASCVSRQFVGRAC